MELVLGTTIFIFGFTWFWYWLNERL